MMFLFLKSMFMRIIGKLVKDLDINVEMICFYEC